MRRAFARRASSFVVDLGCGYVAVAEQLFDLRDVHARVEQERGRRSAERVRRVGLMPRYVLPINTSLVNS